jgi:16S rRNA (cytosine967-C5)-methyltransferase
VIQDYSSQRTGDFMQWLAAEKRPIKTWDCCAASGGKSILAKDILDTIDLTVSDIRPAVLDHLKKRFSEAGINKYHVLPADLSKPGSVSAKQRYQFIIADTPCTGSGTWGRNPERLCYFKRKEIEAYSLLQQKIVTAAMNCLQPGGYFLYITCSVFKNENEDMIAFLQETQGVELLQMELLHGYQQKADTMFAAMMKKNI